jgi:serine/threonine protein kinase
MNILVNDQGHPLLSDFRLSKVFIVVAVRPSLPIIYAKLDQIIQDVTGAPLTQTSMMTDSCRHFAPETFVDDGVVSRASDIYALGMTILEVIPTNTWPSASELTTLFRL